MKPPAIAPRRLRRGLDSAAVQQAQTTRALGPVDRSVKETRRERKERIRGHHALTLVGREIERRVPAPPQVVRIRPDVLRALATPRKGETWEQRKKRHAEVDARLRELRREHTKPHFSKLGRR